ncbi:aldehyde dehydrogenase family protein [Kytococcus schroeteri]|uniref:aldehyde dehydrogenase family protein n=1 Tax=Kytococcus schroeteri TaxID=138300 RepID=UPI001143616F|nr:aldehyde dehydrogenase family protein [Kytococcus schroeteri]
MTSPEQSTAATVRELAHETWATGRLRELDARREQLRALRTLLREEEPRLLAALREDLRKPEAEARTTELAVVEGEVEQLLKHLDEWLSPRAASVPLAMQPARATVRREPLGAVLVIGPWNYPVNLVLTPLAGALAGGNTVVLKPSELAPATAAVLAELVPQYLDPEVVQVVTGGVPETTALLEQKWDHVFFTGGEKVGRIVMRAAAEHLTPVTLELGGKSPTWVGEDVDLRAVARRIVWGKFSNAGQTCVAPDHVLCTPATQAALVPELERAITDMFGLDPRTSRDYGRIINRKHAERLAAMVEGAAVGGEVDLDALYVSPTVLTNVDDDHPAMAEEIFGPVLPVVTVPDVQAAINRVADGPSPLALYLFTRDADVQERWLAGTRSGGVGINVPMAHVGVHSLPFGGVGASGMGSYHGEASVRTFTHERSVLDKPLRPDTLGLAYPPSGPVKRELLRRLL